MPILTQLIIHFPTLFYRMTEPKKNKKNPIINLIELNKFLNVVGFPINTMYVKEDLIAFSD